MDRVYNISDGITPGNIRFKRTTINVEVAYRSCSRSPNAHGALGRYRAGID
jgi:hypothetical protein